MRLCVVVTLLLLFISIQHLILAAPTPSPSPSPSSIRPLCGLSSLVWLSEHMHVDVQTYIPLIRARVESEWSGGRIIPDTVWNRLVTYIRSTFHGNSVNDDDTDTDTVTETTSSLLETADWWDDIFGRFDDWWKELLEQVNSPSVIPICIWQLNNNNESSQSQSHWMQQVPLLNQLKVAVWNLFWFNNQNSNNTTFPICGDGSPFGIVVRRGTGNETTQNNVVMEFGGGGACWSAETCGGDSPTSFLNIQPVLLLFPLVLAGAFPPKNSHYDIDSPSNPNKGWSFVYAPYCTGDIWIGNNTINYANNTSPNNTSSSSLVIHHAGYRNMNVSLSVLHRLFPSPQRVLSTGCSAGGYGSLFATPYIHDMYSDVTPRPVITQFSDSAAGIVTRSFLEREFGVWGVVLPPVVSVPLLLSPSSSSNPEQLHSQVYILIARVYTDIMFSQFNHRNDQTQIKFWTMMGIDKETATRTFPDNIKQAMQLISSSVSNFRFAVVNGTSHCLYNLGSSWTDERGLAVYVNSTSPTPTPTPSSTMSVTTWLDKVIYQGANTTTWSDIPNLVPDITWITGNLTTPTSVRRLHRILHFRVPHM